MEVTEKVFKKLLFKPAAGPDGFTVEYYQTIKSQSLGALLIVLDHRKGRQIIQIIYIKSKYPLISKPCKNNTEKESYISFSLMKTNVKVISKMLRIEYHVI